jgi:malonyl-CoA O-methyltransferase
VRRAFGRAAASYAANAVLAREVGARMLERLQYIKLEPKHILDAGCGDGHAAKQLAGRYPGAQVLGLDFALPMLRAAGGRSSWTQRLFGRTRVRYLCADFLATPLPAGCIDLAWSNLALHCTGDPLPAMREMHRVLRVGGLLMFTCYGPDTLKELKSAFAGCDSRPHVHDFIDMHDLGDMLSTSGFAGPVMDMEFITMTFANVDDLLADLRGTGQGNALAARRRSLTGKGVFDCMRAAYEGARREGRLPASFEIIYGHAWKPQPRISDDGRAIVRLHPRRV